MAQRPSARPDHSSRARRKRRIDSPERSTSRAYERASCEYQTSRGLKAASAAATRPARSDTSLRPSRYATGMVAVPHKAESERYSDAAPVGGRCI